MKEFKDITVVVQGPVQTLNGREQEENITYKCLSSIRKYLPGASIILSTWEGQNIEGLDFDELVLNADPGSNIRNIKPSGEQQKYNNNRQIVSSYNGLKKVRTQYAMKLRSDNYLTSNSFVQLQKDYKQRSEKYKFLKERVVVADVFSRKYAKGFPVAFHISDFFYFGLAEDVLSLWSMPLFEDFQPTDHCQYNKGYPDFVTDCTQELFIKALQQFDLSLNLESLLDNDKNKLYQSELCIANNLIVAPMSMIGLELTEKFKGKARVSSPKGKAAHIHFFEWLIWYKKYCDVGIELDDLKIQRLTLFFRRLFYIFPYRLETLYKIKKRKKKH
ncbi:WavE lipopolysaccharide synthesis family protein [Vibrio rumoiensis]|uniref:WavE lipopolysaccharide synthesis n=1 Tax=Vibrio rumoiensis 1S-45 TaxID=1188252 RepID=A0A1E5E6M7_9VIBR|nr:WavE lipopolysaccharide synthesis family protein [Vibrio rumoiensis]OEF29483.1 WavE lipopolysaccharide synthesis [Vibrio rumoiensis 1S-45]